MLKLGFWIFLGSETLFFGSLISTYMVYKHESVVGPYPTEILNIPLTSISTFVLLMSSLAVVIALDALQRGLRSRALFWIMAVVVLGSMFLGFQAFEFTHFYHEGLTLQTNLFGSTFFVLTGFHGAHVTVGVIWILILWMDAFRGKLGPDNALRFEIAGLYWHFVDIVWIAIFTLIYLIN
jgi:heme/copper-type cytochrome/quinol oxidase subunit 3